MSIWLCLLIGFAIWVVLAWLVRDEVSVAGFFAGLAASCFCVWLAFGEETEAGRRSREDAARRDAQQRTPHVIREADGCKVYAFKEGDRWHYFTRCPSADVTHDAPRVEGCGKNCTRDVRETVTTRTPE